MTDLEEVPENDARAPVRPTRLTGDLREWSFEALSQAWRVTHRPSGTVTTISARELRQATTPDDNAFEVLVRLASRGAA